MRTHHHRIIPASRLLIEERRRTKRLRDAFCDTLSGAFTTGSLTLLACESFFLSETDDALRATDDFDISWWYQSKVLLDGSL